MGDERFWAHVEKTPTCWRWTGAHNWAGYGKLTRGGRTRAAHRIAWELTFGPIPEGMHVCHRCDNPPCVRPAHLFLGTRSDNMQDAFSKGRGVHQVMQGEEHGRAKLTATQVEELRAQYAAGGAKQQELANAYGISNQQVSNIIRGSNWSTQ